MALFRADLSPTMTTLNRRLLRIAAWIAILGTIAFAGLVLTVKYALLPRLGEQRVFIEQSVSRAIGLPVAIGRLTADWRGWHPRLRLDDVRIAAPGQETPLTLPSVEAAVSWTSLVFFEPRLVELRLQAPKLTIRRDKTGVLYVAGIRIDEKQAGGAFPDWLLRQRLILVSDAEVTWLDDKIGAPPLKLAHLSAALHNLLGRHRFGLTALPPTDVAQRLDLRGDLRGGSVSQPEGWSGQLYSRVDAVDLAAWNRQTPWSQETVRGGHGQLRFWLTVKKGMPRQIVGDARLRDISLQFAQDLRILAFRDLDSRIVWQRLKNDRHDIHTEGLRYTTATGETSSAAKLGLQLQADANGQFKPTQAEAEGLRLEAVTALADAIPLPKNMHDLVEKLSPRGLVDFAQVQQVDGNRYAVTARFHDVGVNAYDKLPGINGLSGRIKTDQAGGEAEIDSRNFSFDDTSIFRNPLAFATVEGRLTWQLPKQGGLKLDIAKLKFANADLTGEAHGSIQTAPGRPAQADIQASLGRGEANAVWQYLPKAVSDDAYAWLKRSLVGGYASDVQFILKGSLDQFPFDQGGGEFKVGMRLNDGVLDYAPGWPKIDNIQGSLVFHDKAMTLIAQPGAHIHGIPLGEVSAIIPDLHYSYDEQLVIRGSASGPTQRFLDFMRNSPVFEHTGRFTEFMRAEGKGNLALGLDMPLRHIADTTVKGSYQFSANRIDPGASLPTLSNASGQIDFTENGVSAKQLHATLFDQPAELGIASEAAGRVRIDLRGRVNAQAISERLPSIVAQRIAGTTDYRAQLSIKDHKSTLRVESNLVGLTSTLPPPFDKKAAAAVPLLIAKSDGSEAINLRYSNLLSASVVPGGNGIKRAVFRLGGGETTLPAEGIALRGGLPTLDLDAWRTLLSTKDTGKGVAVNDVNVSFASLTFNNRPFHDINIQAKPIAKGWQLKLNGRDVQGEASYFPAANGSPARIAGQFKKLMIPERKDETGTTSEAADEPTQQIDIQAERFGLGAQDYGALTLHLTPKPQRWQIHEFALNSPDGQINLDGELSTSSQRASTLNLKAKANNLGKLLARLGHPDTIKRGEGEASGLIGWQGGTNQFQIARLSGNLAIKAKNGQFTKVDPGVGRLLGILSLQALPRRITLDFRDIFSEGFAFDEIEGNVTLDRGTAALKGMRMDGPSAKVLMSGQIGLADETQSLRVAVTPRLEDSLAVGAALIGGPAAGVGAYVASKLLKDPLGQATAFEYQVTGTWANPEVVRLTPTAAPSPHQEDKP